MCLTWFLGHGNIRLVLRKNGTAVKVLQQSANCKTTEGNTVLDIRLVADLINREYQAGMDEMTLASLARLIAEILPAREQETFIDIATMGGLTL